MLLNCGAGDNSWEFLGQQGDPTSSSKRKSVLNIHWKDWCWSWNSNTLSTWLIWKDPDAGKDWRQEEKVTTNRGWDGWMASRTQWTWVWVNSGSWWWTGRPGELQSMGSQRVGHDWATELNWGLITPFSEHCIYFYLGFLIGVCMLFLFLVQGHSTFALALCNCACPAGSSLTSGPFFVVTVTASIPNVLSSRRKDENRQMYGNPTRRIGITAQVEAGRSGTSSRRSFFSCIFSYGIFVGVAGAAVGACRQNFFW